MQCSLLGIVRTNSLLLCSKRTTKWCLRTLHKRLNILTLTRHGWLCFIKLCGAHLRRLGLCNTGLRSWKNLIQKTSFLIIFVVSLRRTGLPSNMTLSVGPFHWLAEEVGARHHLDTSPRIWLGNITPTNTACLNMKYASVSNSNRRCTVSLLCRPYLCW